MTKKAPQKPSKSLLENDLIKYWLLNTSSLNTREAYRVDLTDFITALKIYSTEDFQRLKRPS